MANNDSFFQRLTRLFRSGPALRRRIKGYDYNSFYDKKVLQNNLGYNGPLPFKREASQFSVLGSYGILNRMASYAEFCLHPDTKIATPTAEGFTTIKEMAERHSNGEKQYVFSCNNEEKSIVCVPITNCWKTKTDEVIEVEIDSGSKILCTKEHQWMLRDGTYRQAQDLKPDDALMPFNRSIIKSEYRYIVVAIRQTNIVTDVYDIEVAKYHNFAISETGNLKDFVFVHNSEMDSSTPIISKALDIYADEAFAGDENGKCFHVFSDNPEIKKELEELFYDVMNIEFNGRTYIRNLVKYGDMFLYQEVAPDLGIINVQPISVNELEREEGFDSNDPYAVRFKWLTRGQKYLENWQVTHFRILGNDLFLPYGTSLLESARRPWRQYLMMVDAMMVYRLVRCLHGDSVVRTDSGYKHIRDIKVGDKVYSYNKEKNSLVLSTVTDWMNNGKQQIWEVCSKHRKIKANATHPILVFNKKIKTTEYVEVNKLISKVHQFIMPKTESKYLEIPLELNEKNYEWCGKLTDVGQQHFLNSNFLKSKRNYEKEIAKLFSYPENRIHQFLYAPANSIKGIPYKIALAVCEQFNIPIKELVKFPKGMYNLERLNLPKTIDIEFARFFGFMVGDGFLSKNLYQLGFATGIDKQVNEYYTNILKKYCSSAIFHHDKRSHHLQVGKVKINSSYFSHLMMDFGFTSSVYTKKIPEWVFKSSDKIKEAFIDGLADADGHRRTQRKTASIELGLCNKMILEGVKELCHQLGWNVSSKISERIRKPRLINGNQMVKSTKSFELYLTKTKTGLREDILKVNPIDEIDNVYDIRVDNDLHNFISDGCVVHNSPERRVYYIDVGAIAPNDIPGYMEAAREALRGSTVVNSSTGRLDIRYNPVSVDEDIFIPLRGTNTATKVEPLPGGQNITATEDIELIQSQLFTAVGVPKPYLGYDESLCISAKTLVNLLNGQTKSIVELVEDFKAGKENWVYSTTLDGSVRPGKISWAGKTKQVNELYKITLDNGKFIECTENHPFLLRYGQQYKRADELQVGDSLMPIYFKLSSKQNGQQLEGYQMVFDNKLNHWVYTHRMVKEHASIGCSCSGVREVMNKSHYKTISNIKKSLLNDFPPTNHKVVSVEKISLTEPEWVYDVTIENYNNFLVESGVVIHNSSKATLAQEDIRFSRTITILQKILIAELNKLAILHLYAKGFDGEDLIDYELKLSNPSSVALQQKLDIWRTKFDIISTIGQMDSKPVDMQWQQKELLGFSDDDVARIKLKQLDDARFAKKIEAVSVEEDEPATLDPFDPSNYQLPGGNPVVTTDHNKEKERGDGELIPSSGNEIAKDSSTGLPIKANSSVQDRKNYRRRKGAAELGSTIPSFRNMLNPRTNTSLRDVSDQEFLKGPMYEQLEKEIKHGYGTQMVSRSVRRMLENFQKAKVIKSQKDDDDDLLIEITTEENEDVLPKHREIDDEVKNILIETNSEDEQNSSSEALEELGVILKTEK